MRANDTTEHHLQEITTISREAFLRHCTERLTIRPDYILNWSGAPERAGILKGPKVNVYTDLDSATSFGQEIANRLGRQVLVNWGSGFIDPEDKQHEKKPNRLKRVWSKSNEFELPPKINTFTWLLECAGVNVATMSKSFDKAGEGIWDLMNLLSDNDEVENGEEWKISIKKHCKTAMTITVTTNDGRMTVEIGDNIKAFVEGRKPYVSSFENNAEMIQAEAR